MSASVNISIYMPPFAPPPRRRHEHRPRHRHTTRFLLLYLSLSPLLLWDSSGWATVPFSALVSFLLLGTENIGAQIEEPFAVLPLGAMCRWVGGPGPGTGWAGAALWAIANPGLLPARCTRLSHGRRHHTPHRWLLACRSIEDSVREMGAAQQQWDELLSCALLGGGAPAPRTHGGPDRSDSSLDPSLSPQAFSTGSMLAAAEFGSCGLVGAQVAIPAGPAAATSSGGGSSGGTAPDMAAAASSGTSTDTPHSRSSSIVSSISRRGSFVAAAVLGLLGVSASGAGAEAAAAGDGGCAELLDEVVFCCSLAAQREADSC
jgi:hypothetical protein